MDGRRGGGYPPRMIDPKLVAAGVSPPETATHWQISRASHGERRDTLRRPEYLAWGEEGAIKVQEWPIADCTRETIVSRWGDGRYRLHCYEVDPETGKRTSRGKYVFETVPSAPKPAHEAVNPNDPVAMGRMLFEMQREAEERADARNARQLEQLANLAGLRPNMQVNPDVSAPAVAALPPELVRELEELRTERAVRRALDEARAEHRAEIDRLERRMREFEEDRRGGGDAEPFGGDRSFLMSVLNFAASNPKAFGELAGAAGPLLAPILAPLVAKLLGGAPSPQLPQGAPAADQAPQVGPVAPAPVAPVVGSPYGPPQVIRRPARPRVVDVSRETPHTNGTPSDVWQPIVVAPEAPEKPAES